MRSSRLDHAIGCLLVGILCGLTGAPPGAQGADLMSPPVEGCPSWLISNDPVSPHANTAAPANGPTTLYLWGLCMDGPPGGEISGLEWSEMALVTAGNLTVVSGATGPVVSKSATINGRPIQFKHATAVIQNP